ncbi:hypothetical protein PoB_004342500 [Plakobranchus ocellatus]|uniref:Uncharacterized protein n=1 Tax=Plakobranchus ocellatus TaxID=259542 RepID=A0AAV4BCW0_9GAST|nr:hypothetical protein PoB_004342500 [Plakobranchus ocellatus]
MNHAVQSSYNYSSFHNRTSADSNSNTIAIIMKAVIIIACLSLAVCIAIVAGTASPQQGDLRLSGPPSGQGAGGGARTRDRRVPADFRADSLATVPPTPHQCWVDTEEH